MLGIGIVVGLLGYGLVFWGDQLWNGCTQNSFLDIMWPGGQRFKPCAPSTPAAPYTPPGLPKGVKPGHYTLTHPAPGH